MNENSHYWYKISTVSGTTATPAGSADAYTLAAVDTLAATAASTSEIDLTWDLNVTDASAIQIYRSTGGSTFTFLANASSGTATTYADTGLADNTTYYYRVRAVEGGVDTSFTAPASDTTAAVVGFLSATPASTSAITLAWTLDGTASYIEIDRSTDGLTYTPITTTLSGSATSYSDTGLNEDTHYFYQVRALYASGHSSFSDADAWTSPIQSVNYTSTTDSITLTWANFSLDATAIEVERLTDGGGWTVLTTALPASFTTFTDTGLPDNAQYQYALLAIEPGGPGTFTNPIVTYTLPDAPTGLTVTSTTTTQVGLGWTNNSGSSTIFEILRSDDGGEDYEPIDFTGTGATSYSDSSVLDGTFYEYQVAAVTGDYSESNSSATVNTTTPLIAPTDATAAPNGQSEIDLSWTNNSQTATGYAIYRSTSATGTFSYVGTTAGIDDTYFSDTLLSPGTGYYYQVFATEGLLSSSAAATANAATDPTIAISGDLTVQNGTAYVLTPTVNLAAGVSDPITSWSIDWGDGTGPHTYSGSPNSFQYTYAGPGNYVIAASATVPDETIDAPNTVSVTVLVPTPTLSVSPGWEEVAQGATVTLTPTYAGNGAGPPSAYLVDWNDGTALDTYSGTATSFTHSYAHGGTDYGYLDDVPPDELVEYTPVVTAVTAEGAIYATADVSVTGPNPVCLGGGQVYGTENASTTIPFTATLSDPPPTTYNATFGDGQTASGSLPNYAASTISHTYVQSGVYLANMTSSAGSNDSFWVDESDSQITMTPPPETVVGSGQSFSVTASYTGADGIAAPIAYVNWGDGTGMHPATVTAGSGGSGTITASSSSALPPGVLTPIIYLFDPAGGSNSTSFTLDVWGAVLGDGKASDVLVGSDSGQENRPPSGRLGQRRRRPRRCLRHRRSRGPRELRCRIFR